MMQMQFRNHLFKRAIVFALLIGLSMANIVSADTVGIDNFNDFQRVCDPTTGACPDSESAIATTNAIGGFRTISIVKTAGDPVDSVSARSGSGTDFLSYSSDNFTTGSLMLVWDGNSNPATIDYTGLGSVDLINAGVPNTGIYLRQVTNDLEFTLRVEVYTNATDWSYGEVVIPAGSSNANFNIPFASFTTGGGAGATLTNVGAIVMEVANVESLDFSIDYIAADNQTPTAVTLSSNSVQSQAGYIATLALVGVFGLALLSFATVQKRR
jgi:hypothetical protein